MALGSQRSPAAYLQGGPQSLQHRQRRIKALMRLGYFSGMAKPWDSVMKWLVEANAKHFVNWLMAQATFVRPREVELKPEHRFADALLEILFEDQPALIEIEFQTTVRRISRSVCSSTTSLPGGSMGCRSIPI